MVQEQKQKASNRREEQAEETHTGVTNTEVSKAAGETVDKIDEVLEDQLDEELLADIDDVLESDAEKFVAAFVQQGGE